MAGTVETPGLLPELLRPLFWDCEFGRLTLPRYPDFIAGRVLSSGGWDQIRWLRQAIGDDGIRDYLRRTRGRALDRRRIRFWEVVLRLPHEEVSDWLAAPGRQVWDQRAR